MVWCETGMTWLWRPLPILSTRARGFTLVEVVVTVAVVAILAAIAVPSLTSLMAANALDGAAGEFRAAIARSRQEAVTRNIPVTIAPITTAGSSGGNVQWHGRFTMFTNPLGRNDWATASSDVQGSGTDTRRAERLAIGETDFSAGMVRLKSAATTAITVRGDGQMATPAGVTMVLCVPLSQLLSNNARLLAIDAAGRVSVVRTTLNSCPP